MARSPSRSARSVRSSVQPGWALRPVESEPLIWTLHAERPVPYQDPDPESNHPWAANDDRPRRSDVGVSGPLDGAFRTPEVKRPRDRRDSASESFTGFMATWPD